MLVLVLFGSAYVLGHNDAGGFVAFVAFIVAFVVIAAPRSGCSAGWASLAASDNRTCWCSRRSWWPRLFPFTQNGSDANMSIATQVLIFAAAAIGLNIVVGLAGLLDLGYIAFLGVGAFTAAMLSGSAVLHHRLDAAVLVIMLIAGTVSGAARAADRRADAADLGRLPGHRDARLRRDLPDHGEQPGRHRRARPDATARTASRASRTWTSSASTSARRTDPRLRRSAASPTTTS